MRISDWSSDVCSSDLDCVSTRQHYVRNTAVLVTHHEDAAGNAIEITDFCPRFRRSERMYRPVAFVRIVRPVAGAPRIRVRLRPARDWGSDDAPRPRGSNHIRYILTHRTLRLTQIGRASCRERVCKSW